MCCYVIYSMLIRIGQQECVCHAAGALSQHALPCYHGPLSFQVACNQRGRNASQLNIGGTHLGSFNDRFRDALMGGSPFASPRYQGFATGLATAPNAFTQARAALL